MNLEEILKRTKKKSEQIKYTRKPASIATDDRPYSTLDFQDRFSSAVKVIPEQNINLNETEMLPVKLRTNLGQSQDKVETNLGQYLRQSQDKVRTIRNLDTQSQDKVRTEPRTEARTKLGQSQDKVRTNRSFESIVGLQKRILLFLFDTTKNARSEITPAIAIEFLASSCQTTKLSAQKTIQRMEKLGLVMRSDYKDGRSGWTKYNLNESLYKEMLTLESQDKLRTNSGQTQDKVRTEPRTELRTIESSSSSLNKLTTTTGIPNSDSDFKEIQSLPTDWNEMDISGVEEFGFTKNHVIQLFKKNKLTAEVLQDSIYAFAFDVKKNGKGKSMNKSHLDYFMGIIGKGNPYLPPQNYESPRDEAIRLYLERKEKLEKERQEREERAKEFAFQDWLKGIPEEERQKLLPEFARGLPFGEATKSALKNYFLENIWKNNFTEIVKVAEQFSSEID